MNELEGLLEVNLASKMAASLLFESSLEFTGGELAQQATGRFLGLSVKAQKNY